MGQTMRPRLNCVSPIRIFKIKGFTRWAGIHPENLVILYILIQTITVIAAAGRC